MRYLLLSLLVITSLSSCDIVNAPKGDMASPTPPGGSTVTRNVLLEDCTGFRCNNCPDAAIRAMQLKAIYGDRLVVVGVHMLDEFAKPVEPLDDGFYDTDFRTPAGNTYQSQGGFDITALPIGLVNRKPYNGSIRVSRYSWSTAVAGMIDQQAALDLRIDTLIFDSVAGTVSGGVSAVLLQPLATPHNLTLYLTEDHVIDWQLNNQANPHDVPNYDHRHVLRGALNGTWGEGFLDASTQVGDTVHLTFSHPLPPAPATVLEPNNCALVAYVYSTSGSDKYEVKQVVEREFQP
ncbi:MAG: Omp28-related outer membrane protein [Flavobacteriales bacterium]|nr:Omp28-related outer membrane protein [Flavobacteriales bacterium]